MSRNFSKLLRTSAALAVALAAVAPAPAALAQSMVSVQLGGDGAAAQSLSLPRGKSAIIELPVDARDVLVSDPTVADAVLRTPRRIYVLGVKSGQTDAVFFDGAGRQILSLAIRVDQSTGALEDTLRRVVPGAKVTVEPVNDSLILTGTVANAGEADRVRRVAEQFVAKPEQVVNMLSIAGEDQVTLKVRVVEMRRSVIKQLGLSADAVTNNGIHSYAFGRGNTYGVNGSAMGGGGLCYGQNGARATTVTNTDTTTTTGSPAPGSIQDVTNAVSSAYKLVSGASIDACFQAFERTGLVRTLAEPNLTAISGESAKFLAGGEFPVPTGIDQNGKVTVEYKPFGVGLGFTPVVMSEGRISMKISTEVSELSQEGAFTLGGGGTSLVLPALSVRRAETAVELPSGGSLMIAGLLQQKAKQNLDALPGATEVPVLGALFRSRDYLNEETELVVIVTPYLVRATDPDRLQAPGQNLQMASDASTILLGRLNKVYRGDAAAAPPEAYQGPVGYVIE
ncbi:type II and III secretion system protein family protein [Caulobacter sp. 17J65-9]|uniref:type II and III secretion system protein family protein n=1 Tax=Caulobacter sp. 17J65-9 TaxID=2709382 RepID=UPI0013C80EB8|nr:type II and III secretion system protein family protein [Caulobacter sp. 17J65-9]NEX94690.1 type II and III secretion system protein family protein [Caulobacter sp. 17J65-9]